MNTTRQTFRTLHYTSTKTTIQSIQNKKLFACRCCESAPNKNYTSVNNHPQLHDANNTNNANNANGCIVDTCIGRGVSGCILTTNKKICCTDKGTDGSGCTNQDNICGIGGDVSLCNRTVTSCSGGIVSKWDGWATSTKYNDPTPFCGNFEGADYHVAVPWIILCKEFSTKNCLVNHMCPNCAECGCRTNPWGVNDASTGTDCSPGCDDMSPGTGCVNHGTGPMQANFCDGSKDQRPSCMGKTCPPISSHNNGIDEYGICWEVQPLKDTINTVDVSKYNNHNFPLYNYSEGKNIDEAEPLSDKTYIIKLQDGCGGNCKGNNPTCTADIDCMNNCSIMKNKEVYTDPCMITNEDTSCKFMSTISNTEPYYSIDTNDRLQNLRKISGGTCPLPFDVSTGKHYRPETYTNWCSGANMHFDFNTTYKNNIKDVIPFVENLNMLRYRRIQCPKYSKKQCTPKTPNNCSTKTTPS